MQHKSKHDEYEREFEEDMSAFNYSKQYNKFMVRDHKLKKRKDRSEDWYD